MLPFFKEKFVRLPARASPAFPERNCIFSPLIDIRLFNKKDEERYIDFKALIDTGASLNIFPGEFGRAIGLDIVNDKIERIEGIGGQTFDAYVHDVTLGIGGWKFSSCASFTFANIVCPVLGRDGFFNLFEVKIDYSKKEMEFKAKVEPLKY